MAKGKKAERLDYLKNKYRSDHESGKSYDWFKPNVEDVYLMNIENSRPIRSELYPETEQTMYIFGDGGRAFSLSGYAMRAMNDALASAGYIPNKTGVKIEWTVLEQKSKNNRTFKDISYEIHGTFKVEPKDEDMYEENEE